METFYGPTIELSATASRLDTSWPWFNPVADTEGLGIIEDVGIGAIEAHNMSLVEELVAQGVPVPFEEENRSPIVSLELDDPERAARALQAEQIIASVRAGRLRASVHLYNTPNDIKRLATAIG